MVAKTLTTETTTEITPPATTVKPTEQEKEPVHTESKVQATDPTVTATEPTMTRPTEETTTTTSAVGEKSTSPIEETVPRTTPQLTEEETTETEPHRNELKAETESPKVTEPEHKEKPAPFDIDHWIAYAMSYAESKGLVLSDTAVDCWDNPIRAGEHCIYLERDTKAD